MGLIFPCMNEATHQQTITQSVPIRPQTPHETRTGRGVHSNDQIVTGEREVVRMERRRDGGWWTGDNERLDEDRRGARQGGVLECG